jgi:hypothetical protein
MNPYEATTEELLAAVGGPAKLFESSKITTVQGYRNTEAGPIEVTVELHDRGESADPRWSVVARTDNGRSASGNPDNNLDVALATVHWWDLDG